MRKRDLRYYLDLCGVQALPIVLLITLKYSLTIEGASDGDPVEVLLHDKILLMLVILYLAVMLGILYI